ncbi:MAG: hypothetical protein Q9167_001088 [Letrouitia subvulpina]
MPYLRGDGDPRQNPRQLLEPGNTAGVLPSRGEQPRNQTQNIELNRYPEMGWDDPPEVVTAHRYQLNLLTQPLSQDTVKHLEARGFGPISGQYPVGSPATALVPQGQITVRDLATAQRPMPFFDQSSTVGSGSASSQFPVGGLAEYSEPTPAAGRYAPLASSGAPDTVPYENQPQQYSEPEDPATRGCAVSL